MDVDVITALVSNLGFPIFMCGALMYYIYTEQKKSRETIDKLQDTIQQNTSVLSTILNLLHIKEKEEK